MSGIKKKFDAIIKKLPNKLYNIPSLEPTKNTFFEDDIFEFLRLFKENVARPKNLKKNKNNIIAICIFRDQYNLSSIFLSLRKLLLIIYLYSYLYLNE